MLFKDRNIALVVLARFVSRVGGTAVFFVGIWGMAAYTFEATPRQLAWVMMGSAVAGIIGSMISGVLIDRFGPRWVLMGAELLSIPAVLLIATSQNLVQLGIYNAIFAVVGIPTFTAGASFPPYLVSGRKPLEAMNALIEGAGSLGFVLGPAVGAVVSQAFGVRAVLWVMVAGAVISSAAVFFARVPRQALLQEGQDVRSAAENEGRRARQSGFAQLKDGLRVTYTTRSLRYFVLMATATWLGFGSFSALEPLFYRDVVGVGPEWIGWINALYGAGLVAGAWLLPRLPGRVVSARGLAWFVAAVGVATLGYVGTNRLGIIAPGAVVWGVAIGSTMPLLRTLIQIDAPHDYVGRVMGAMQYHQNAAELIPLAIAPSVAVIVGVQPVLVASGLIVAALALGSLRTATAIDRATGRGSIDDTDARSAEASA